MKHLLLLGLLFAACPRDEPQEPTFSPDDRLLQKLKTEQERLAREQKKKVEAEAEPDPLTKVVTGTSAPDFLGIPRGVAADLGDVAFELVEVQRSQTVSGKKVSLSTADRFLRVSLDANAEKDTQLDLTAAQLVNGDKTAGIARDVQRLGKGSPLSLELKTHALTRVVLFFEAPDEMIGKGLKLVLTTDTSRVELPLQ
ncbi:MAG: hypothetical protein DI536_17285 [Archangium gephyra]|uniref:Uncharacterized protein n=1 Tax=Archangium gephyra TaxID=48 RepID=A0A2W5TDW8_9BACT|nr:MAG: hypothetical protein DI536_17285 [Archangium gephyra]